MGPHGTSPRVGSRSPTRLATRCLRELHDRDHRAVLRPRCRSDALGRRCRSLPATSQLFGFAKGHRETIPGSTEPGARSPGYEGMVRNGLCSASAPTLIRMRRAFDTPTILTTRTMIEAVIRARGPEPALIEPGSCSRESRGQRAQAAPALLEHPLRQRESREKPIASDEDVNSLFHRIFATIRLVSPAGRVVEVGWRRDNNGGTVKDRVDGRHLEPGPGLHRGRARGASTVMPRRLRNAFAVCLAIHTNRVLTLGSFRTNFLSH